MTNGEQGMYHLGRSAVIFMYILGFFLIVSGLFIVLSTKFIFPTGTLDIFFYISLVFMVLGLTGLIAGYIIYHRLSDENKGFLASHQHHTNNENENQNENQVEATMTSTSF
jgi:hypothetical protein